jgi:hypothetical protein
MTIERVAGEAFFGAVPLDFRLIRAIVAGMNSAEVSAKVGIDAVDVAAKAREALKELSAADTKRVGKGDP